MNNTSSYSIKVLANMSVYAQLCNLLSACCRWKKKKKTFKFKFGFKVWLLSVKNLLTHLVLGIIQRHFVMSVNLGSNNWVSPSILLIILFWINSMKVLQNKWQEKILRTEVSDRKNRSTLSRVHHCFGCQRFFCDSNLDSLRRNRDREREPD